MLRRRLTENLLHQRAETGRIFDARQTGGHLHVEQPLGEPAGGLQAEFEFAAAGVDHDLTAFGDDGLPEGPHVADGQGVDHRQMSVGGRLHQTQHRAVAVLGNELGVEGDRRGPGKPTAIVANWASLAMSS